MCSNMNVSNSINAKTHKVEDNFNYCKDFVDVETNAYIVAAAMTHFDMKTIDAEVVPEDVRLGSPREKQQWLYSNVK